MTHFKTAASLVGLHNIIYIYNDQKYEYKNNIKNNCDFVLIIDYNIEIIVILFNQKLQIQNI